MTRGRAIAVLLIVVLTGCLTLLSLDARAGQQWDFSLVTGESLTLGDYSLQFGGLIGSSPSYDLYLRGALVARFPSDPPPLNTSEYVYENVSIITTAVTPDGTAATGIVTVQ